MRKPMTATIVMKPRTKGRPRLGRRRKAYTPAATLKFEEEFREAFIAQNKRRKAFPGPVAMEVEIGRDRINVNIYELPENARPKAVTGDIDNYQKAFADALNTVAYVDDKQIQHLDVWFTKEFDDG